MSDEADAEGGAEADGDGGGSCAPGDDGCGSTELCDDGLDNDCDGEVDEADAGCSCIYGEVQACLPGPPCGLGVGGCVAGWQACAADGTLGACTEAIAAADEVLDSKDNDCDGETDEGFSGTPTILCPVSFESLPGRWWVLRCEDLCPSTGTPCDCTWSIVPPAGSGSVEVPDRTAETTRVYLDATGNFIVTATILDSRLDTWHCSFAVRASAPGLEADLWWIDVDPFEPGNIDLHVHRDPPRTPWFIDDDCHWGNCGGRDGTYVLDWGYADTPLADCPELPTDRSWWDFIPRGGCPNPRLTLESFAAPEGEMFSVDAPAAGDGFRVAAHFYEDGSAFGEIPTDAFVRVSCAGRPVAQSGPVVMTTRDYGTGDIWRVADVEILDTSGACAVTPLGTPGAPDVQGDFSRDYF
ncbi:MAG: hypothetical protein HY905_19925 [Deltaproteobacteria bacterium]|nr:hypothetical protein [Deltaproteobacteria bacterium]